jgi:hypothetical protein
MCGERDKAVTAVTSETRYLWKSLWTRGIHVFWPVCKDTPNASHKHRNPGNCKKHNELIAIKIINKAR